MLGVTLNYDFVHWDWYYMKLSPETAFLFLPEISPIPTHLKDLLANKHVDLWLLWVYQQFGLNLFLLTLSVPLALLATGVTLLSKVRIARAREVASG